jgi:hypothetical protein
MEMNGMNGGAMGRSEIWKNKGRIAVSRAQDRD